ncbi:MAG: B12-binding domain-containing radical SAM protein [Deltaproteobacteria bacterium]|nr:B12-binding domain-containing radical SAM protein [Deltaproteobacteria bacterium]
MTVPNYSVRIDRVAQTTVGPPLGLAYLAAVLRARGYDVSILDANALRLSDTESVRRIVAARPDAVGWTCATPTVDQCARQAAAVREQSDALLALGGPHVTAAPVETLEKYGAFDVLVRREAEIRFPELLAKTNEGASWDITGLTYRAPDGRVVSTPEPTETVDLAELPFPARDLLPMDRYTGPDGGRVTTMIAARGCPASCAYCYVPRAFGKTMRIRPVDHVVAEMEECLQKYGTRNFNFIDDTFTTDKRWVLDFCEALTRRDLHRRIHWLCLTRVDMVNEKLLRAMKAAGCLRVEMGIESGDDAILGRPGPRHARAASSRNIPARAVRRLGDDGIRHPVLPGGNRGFADAHAATRLRRRPGYGAGVVLHAVSRHAVAKAARRNGRRLFAGLERIRFSAKSHDTTSGIYGRRNEAPPDRAASVVLLSAARGFPNAAIDVPQRRLGWIPAQRRDECARAHHRVT